MSVHERVARAVVVVLALLGAVPAAEILGLVVAIMGSMYAHFCQSAT